MRCHSASAAVSATEQFGGIAHPVTLFAGDERADDGMRRIDIRERHLVMERRVAGVAMRFAIPFARFKGVSLEVFLAAEAENCRIGVRLLHEDEDLSIVLYSAEDDSDVTAAWQFWGKRLGLPLLLRDGDGRYVEPYPRLGSLRVARPRPRRTPAHFAKRRPRFLVRRRPGRPAEHPVIHREREIIART
jgi:hypothetical protein